MKLGAIDFGTTVLAYGAKADVESEGIDLAGLSGDVTRARSVSAAYFPVLDQFFQSKHGIKVLAIWPYPAQVIFCKAPINLFSSVDRLRLGANVDLARV